MGYDPDTDPNSPLPSGYTGPFCPNCQMALLSHLCPVCRWPQTIMDVVDVKVVDVTGPSVLPGSPEPPRLPPT
eukprot:g65308.t1